MNISLSYYSGIGKRKNNEDAVSVMENMNGLLALVADGLGGQDHGEFASRQAIKTVNDALSDSPISSDLLKDAITVANEEIFHLQDQYPGAQTTIAALWLSERYAIAMHVGDTRIYQFRDDAILYQSADHTIAQLAVMAGDLKPEEIRTYKDRNKLFRALGNFNAPKIADKLLEVKTGDRLLVCSDGFWESILENEMLQMAKQTSNAEEWLRQMREIAEPAAKDNNTAVAIVIN